MSPNRKIYTLVLPVRPPQVLLGLKLRGFGINKYNGFGGKVEPNETILAGAIRELHEESGLAARDTEQVGLLLLRTTADDTVPELEIHVFVVTQWDGDEVETEEMRPRWCTVDTIPTAEMWEETGLWMKPFLTRWMRGEKVGFAHYVEFHGGPEMERGGVWDCWHGMGEGGLVWREEGWKGWSGWEEWVADVRGKIRETGEETQVEVRKA